VLAVKEEEGGGRGMMIHDVPSADLIVPVTPPSTLCDSRFFNLPDGIRHSPSLATSERAIDTQLFLNQTPVSAQLRRENIGVDG